MQLLSIDFGTKKLGLAWCDTGIGVVLPFGIAKSKDEVIKIIKEENLDKIIIGLPISMSGEKENTNITRVKKFAEVLKQEIDLPIEFYDERLSSQMADSLGGDASRDEKSAMVILQGYIDKNNL